jgi:glycine betaine/proline transport system ATP-binding protein
LSDNFKTNAGSSCDEICVEVEGLWKVFGPNPEQVLASKELRSASKQAVLEKTGCVVAVRDVSFQVKMGEFFVIIGLSGSGKSTLIRLLLRLIEPTAGRIIINGQDICRYDGKQLTELRRRTTSMVFQHFGLFPHRSVLDNVAYGLKVRGEEKEARYQSAREAIETVGLKEWEHYPPSALSGGMQQRVGLARALATDPKILLMDEPFSGLDPLIRRQMQDELIDIIQDKVRRTILFVTHDLNEALKMGERIAIMRDGDIIQIGAPEEVITTPADDYVREFCQDASMAQVLTASNIMDQPSVLLYDWQGPKAALKILQDTDMDSAFLITRERKFVGLVTVPRLAEVIKKEGASLKEAVEPEPVSCTPDTLLEDLFILAAATEYSVAVVDEEGKLVGEVDNSAILLSMSQENHGDKENKGKSQVG